MLQVVHVVLFVSGSWRLLSCKSLYSLAADWTRLDALSAGTADAACGSSKSSASRNTQSDRCLRPVQDVSHRQLPVRQSST